MTKHTWSEIAAKGHSMKVPTINRSQTEDAPTETMTIYELAELKNLMKVHRAENMLGMALHDNTVLFELPTSEFRNAETTYEIMHKQIGPTLGARIIRPNNNRPVQNFLVEARFETQAAMALAVTQGLIVEDMQYRAVTTRLNKGALPKMVRVHVAGIPFEDTTSLKEKLILSLKYYGKVCQIQILRRLGVFEGAISALLDTDT
ncbi:hypothetical protein BC941DRAFT_364769, partial [Chlamydoabsidia padenii]